MVNPVPTIRTLSASPQCGQRVRGPWIPEKTGMAGGALSYMTRCAGHMTGANRDPIGVKGGFVRKLDAKPTVLASQARQLAFADGEATLSSR